MSTYIVDASIAVKWLFAEVHSEEVFRLLEDRYWLHAPDFLTIEVDNVVCKRIRRNQINEEQGQRLRSVFRQLPIQNYAFSLLLNSAFSVAVQTRQNLYDCLYVALAVHLDAQMVTADRRFYDGLVNGPFAGQLLWVQDIP